MLHQRDPANSLICFGLGVRLLARDDDAGRALIVQAMKLDEDLTFDVCEALRDHCWRRGQAEQAHAWHRRLVDRKQLQDAATEERKQILASEKLERHDLPEQAIASLRSQLQEVPGLHKAYFVKKNVRHLKHHPCYVLGFTVGGMFQRYEKRCADKTLATIRKTVQFPGETLIINVEGESSLFGRKLYWIRGSRIL